MTERHVDNEGANLYCVDEGNGEPAVVLVHASGADSSTWGDVATGLRGRCRVIRYDRRGYGRSTPSAKASLAAHGADAAAVIERLECGPAVVVGLSAGATIALQLAVLRPELVRGLVLHEPPFHAKRHPSLATIGAVIRMQRLHNRGRDVEAAESFTTWAYAYPDGHSAYAEYPQLWRAVVRTNAASAVNDIAAVATGETIARRDVSRLSMPVVCTVGELSRRANQQAIRRLASWLPNARLETIRNAAHEVVLTNPGAITTPALALMASSRVPAIAAAS